MAEKIALITGASRGLGAALALDALLRLLRWPERLRPLTFALPYLALVALDLYALWRSILPALT